MKPEKITFGSMRQCILLFFLLWFQKAFSQENCEFSVYMKQGGLYYFSTFYTSYSLDVPREGECSLYYNGKPYEKRIFLHGQLQEETLYDTEKGAIRSSFKRVKQDSVIAILNFSEPESRLKQVNTYYLNSEGKRCWKEEHFRNNKLFSVCFYRNLSNEEILAAGLPSRPDHQIDADGFTDISIKFGEERLYHETGELRIVQHYRFQITDSYTSYEILDGKYLSYWENGKLREQGAYVNGAKSGKWVSYYNTGDIHEKQEFENGVNVGTLVSYYDGRKIQRKVIFGPEYYWPTGYSQSFFPNGKLLSESVIYADGKGYQRSYFDNGQLQEESIFDHGPNEIYSTRSYFKNGQMHSKSYPRGQNDTIYVRYFEGGIVESLNLLHRDPNNRNVYTQTILKNYTTGLPETYSYTSNSNGEVHQELYFYYENGMKEHEIISQNSTRLERYFWPNGTLSKEVNLLNNVLHGWYITQTEAGIVSKQCYFENGRRKECKINQFQMAALPNESDLEKASALVRLSLIANYRTGADTLEVAPDELSRRTTFLAYLRNYLHQYYPSLQLSEEKLEGEKIQYSIYLPEHLYNPFSSSIDSLFQLMAHEKVTWKSQPGEVFTQFECQDYFSSSYINRAIPNLPFRLSDYVVPLGSSRSSIMYEGNYFNSLVSMVWQGESYEIVFASTYMLQKVIVYATGEVEWANGVEPKVDLPINYMFKD